MGQKASIVSRGKMSQKSISSFFSKAATKKTEEKKPAKVDTEENQNPAKTKTFQDKSSPTLTKKRVGVIGSDSEDDSKENSKVLANKAKGTTDVPNDEKQKSTEPEEATVDTDGLPPLRKTARNPAFKRKIEESNDDHKKLKEDTESDKEESKLEAGGKKLSNKEKQKEDKKKKKKKKKPQKKKKKKKKK